MEMGEICEVHNLTGEKLITSIILAQAKVVELEGAKQNHVEGTPPNLQDATPRQVTTAFTKYEQLKHAQDEHNQSYMVGRGQKEDKDRPRKACYCCTELGHYASSCPTKRRSWSVPIPLVRRPQGT